jgi:hypothetical protein
MSFTTAANPKRCEDVPPGWRLILEQLVMAFPGQEPEPQIRNTHEKFGRLRVFTDVNDDAVTRLIEVAQEKALVTCDRCGLPGWLQSEFQGAIAVRCKLYAL